MPTPIRVLIVEDSQQKAADVSLVLREGGYDVEWRHADSAAALAARLEEKTWDIAICGALTDGFRGTEALSVILEKGLDLPFLLFGDAISEKEAIEAVRMGARGAIGRDSPAQLLSAIQRELRQAALRQRQQQTELRMRQLEKLEALGKLAGGIAHDFNNVLSAIMGWAELGARDVEPTSDASESFEQIRQQAKRAASLTRRLLGYARREMLEPCEVDLNSMAGETISLLQRVIGDNIEITLALAPELGTTRADPSQIERVLMNLCLNARDAMPEGGTLRIETRNVSLNDGHASRHHDARPGDYVLLSVSDTGSGMAPETIERIFEPFFTTKAVGRGTGLGLTTALGLVTQYDGWIDVASRPGEGSTFHVFLPASMAAATETPARDTTETIPVGESGD
jgi:two-component system cell cycle sensor histidine kinase/response regulator CckA